MNTKEHKYLHKVSRKFSAILDYKCWYLVSFSVIIREV